MSNTLKVVFAGTPEFAATHLSALIASNHEIVGVYTQPDRPKGRGKQLQASAVKVVALEAKLPVFQPASLKGEAEQAELRSLGADIMVVVAYGLLLPQAVLDIPPLGCINVHGSILPRWRGAAPIQRAVEAGDAQSGVTIMQMEAGLDTGPMLFKSYCDITSSDTAATLHDKLAELGPPALLETLDKLSKHEIEPEVQDDELANYARKLSKEEGLIDWSLSAIVLDRKIRAFNPFPMTYTLLDGERIRIIEAKLSGEQTNEAPGTILIASKDGIDVSTEEGLLTLTRIQLPGKKAMCVGDALNGFADKFKAGTVFG